MSGLDTLTSPSSPPAVADDVSPVRLSGSSSAVLQGQRRVQFSPETLKPTVAADGRDTGNKPQLTRPFSKGGIRHHNLVEEASLCGRARMHTGLYWLLRMSGMLESPRWYTGIVLVLNLYNPTRWFAAAPENYNIGFVLLATGFLLVLHHDLIGVKQILHRTVVVLFDEVERPDELAARFHKQTTRYLALCILGLLIFWTPNIIQVYIINNGDLDKFFFEDNTFLGLRGRVGDTTYFWLQTLALFFNAITAMSGWVCFNLLTLLYEWSFEFGVDVQRLYWMGIYQGDTMRALGGFLVFILPACIQFPIVELLIAAKDKTNVTNATYLFSLSLFICTVAVADITSHLFGLLRRRTELHATTKREVHQQETIAMQQLRAMSDEDIQERDTATGQDDVGVEDNLFPLEVPVQSGLKYSNDETETKTDADGTPHWDPTSVSNSASLQQRLRAESGALRAARQTTMGRVSLVKARGTTMDSIELSEQWTTIGDVLEAVTKVVLSRSLFFTAVALVLVLLVVISQRPACVFGSLGYGALPTYLQDCNTTWKAIVILSSCSLQIIFATAPIWSMNVLYKEQSLNSLGAAVTVCSTILLTAAGGIASGVEGDWRYCGAGNRCHQQLIFVFTFLVNLTYVLVKNELPHGQATQPDTGRKFLQNWAVIWILIFVQTAVFAYVFAPLYTFGNQTVRIALVAIIQPTSSFVTQWIALRSTRRLRHHVFLPIAEGQVERLARENKHSDVPLTSVDEVMRRNGVGAPVGWAILRFGALLWLRVFVFNIGSLQEQVWLASIFAAIEILQRSLNPVRKYSKMRVQYWLQGLPPDEMELVEADMKLREESGEQSDDEGDDWWATQLHALGMLRRKTRRSRKATYIDRAQHKLAVAHTVAYIESEFESHTLLLDMIMEYASIIVGFAFVIAVHEWPYYNDGDNSGSGAINTSDILLGFAVQAVFELFVDYICTYVEVTRHERPCKTHWATLLPHMTPLLVSTAVISLPLVVPASLVVRFGS